MEPERRGPNYRVYYQGGQPPPDQRRHDQPHYTRRQPVYVSYEMPGYNIGSQGRDELIVTKGRFHFSLYEQEELRKAFLIMCLIFALAISDWRGYLADDKTGSAIMALLIGIAAGALALLTGFVGHEIAHKLVAQKYGHWAEFRSNERGLMFGLVLAAVLGFAFVAPGAVMIRGAVSRREEGHISIAGPASNMVWAVLALPLYFLALPWSDGELGSFKYISYQAIFFLLWVNIALGAFNLIPMRPLDGSKILNWSKGAYLGCVLAIVGLVWIALQIPGL